MSDIHITINTPVLTAGKTFKVRYRLLPSGGWSAYQVKTNATFILAGLADGNYELEVILVNADSSECPPTYKKFRVVTPFDCIPFTAEIVQTGSLYYLQINYTAPTGNPPCGWTVVYGGTVVNYPLLPAPPLKIQVPNQPTQLMIIANNCNANQRACFDGLVPAMDPPPCVPIVVGATTVAFKYIDSSGNYVFDIHIAFTQSTPCTNWFTLQCQQLNVLAGQPGVVSYPGFTYGPVPCAATGITFQLTANPNVQTVTTPEGLWQRKFEFLGTLIDKCGKVHEFEGVGWHE